MDVERVNGVDPKREDLLGVFRARACGASQYGHIHLPKVTDITDNMIFGQFQRAVLITISTDDARDFHIRSGFKSLKGETPHIAISYYGDFNLCHIHII